MFLHGHGGIKYILEDGEIRPTMISRKTIFMRAHITEILRPEKSGKRRRRKKM